MTEPRTLRLTKPLLQRGPDVGHFQDLADIHGYPVANDLIFGLESAGAAITIRYDRGFPDTGANSWRNGVVGPRLIRVLEGKETLSAEYQARAAARKLANILIAPLPTPMGAGSEFKLEDAEGAPADNGKRYHAGKDWFAPGGTRVVAPVRGEIVSVTPSRGHSGQVYGGTVKLQGPKWVHVFRHTEPEVHVGQIVAAAQRLCAVTRWNDSPSSSHSHCEIWLTLGGGYDFENMVDPVLVYRNARQP